MKTCFAFRHHVDTELPLRYTGNKAGTLNRPEIEALLFVPTTRIRKYVLDGILQGRPSECGMAFLDIGFGAVEEILYEISENVQGNFSRRKGG